VNQPQIANRGDLLGCQVGENAKNKSWQLVLGAVDLLNISKKITKEIIGWLNSETFINKRK
jgi:hypothetical protein